MPPASKFKRYSGVNFIGLTHEHSSLDGLSEPIGSLPAMDAMIELRAQSLP
jgi:hypothetical protein